MHLYFFHQGKEVPRLKVSTNFTWGEDLHVLDVAALKQKDQSSDSEEEEEEMQSTVQCLALYTILFVRFLFCQKSWLSHLEGESILPCL